MTRKQPKPKTPKPVEAWACGSDGWSILAAWFDNDDTWREFIEANGMNWRAFRVRVCIVPIVNRKPRTKRKEKKK